MAKLVDAVDSKSTSSNRVLVRVRSSAKQKRGASLSFFLPMKKNAVFLGLEVSVSEPADVSGVRSLGGTRLLFILSGLWLLKEIEKSVVDKKLLSSSFQFI